jgi:predicted lipoprotein with Yx(FWY)xxD motif
MMLRAKRKFVGVIGALAVTTILAACGGDPYPTGAATGTADNKLAGDGDVKAPGVLITQVVGKKAPRIGDVVTDSKGWIFYRFDNDSAKPSESNCVESCTDSWPPVLVKSDKKLPAIKGIDKAKVDAIKRADGRWQLTIGGWPMYRFAGDTKAGQWKGQGVNGSWFVATKEGKKNLSLLPAGGADDSTTSEDSTDDSGTSDDTGTGDDSGDGGDTGGGGY